MTSLFCNDTVADFLGHFSLSVAPKLLYYSYIPIFFVSIFFSLYLYKKTKSLESKIILIITSCFCLWILFDIITWISVDATINMLSWQLAVIPDLLIYFFVFYLVYIFNLKRDLPLIIKASFLIFFVFFLSLITTKYNYYDFSIDTCEPSVGPISNILLPTIRVLTLISILLIGMVAIYKKKINRTNIAEIIIFNIGSFLLVLVYGFSQIFGDFTNSYDINLVGPLGMVSFLGLLVFLIVHYKAFDIKLLGAQALVWALVILIGSQFLYMNKMPLSLLIITGATLMIASVVGMMIVRGVKKEVTQREHIEKIAGELKIANKGQENLIHIMNHQVKGFFGIARNIFAELLEGDDYGHMPDESKPLLEKGLESTSTGVDYVQEILRGFNAEKGLLSFESKPINIKDIVLKLLSEQKDIAIKKGLKFESNIEDGEYNINGDGSQLREAFKNLITNGIKYNDYTYPERGIIVNLSSKDKKITFSVKDTGIGISEEDKPNLFKAGGMGKNSLKFNADSSGFGLSTVKGIIEAHGGNVGYKSNEPEKGTTFFIEIPIS